jgi:hypothetical protein
MFHYAEKRGVPVFIAADLAQAVLRKESTFGTGMNLVSRFLESMG